MTNILLITADQWRGECLSALRHPVVRTPQLDALAADGVLFRNHFAQCVPCGPSRASLLTGTYLMNHRSVGNGTPLDSRFTNIALEMRRAGYEPSLIGYTDTSADPRSRDPRDPLVARYEGVLPGFREIVPGSELHYAWARSLAAKSYALPPAGSDFYRWFTPEPTPSDSGPTRAAARYKAEDSDTAFATDRAIEFVTHSVRRPWFLHLSLLRPHPPFVAPAPYNALYGPEEVSWIRGAASPEAEAALHPHVAHVLRHHYAFDGHDPARHPAEEGAIRQLRATYYGLMSEVDDNLGRLFAALRAQGQYDDTLIVFTSDHGEQLWDHWMLGKSSFFDQSVQVPLIVNPPVSLGGTAKGHIVSAFTESVDVMPSVLEAVGLEAPLQCDGESLLPFLCGAAPKDWRQQVHWEIDFRDVYHRRAERDLGIPLDLCSLSVVRDECYKYVYFAALPPLLFDLRDDPDERIDRAADPALARTQLDYAQSMLSWRLAHAERTLTGIRLVAKGPHEVPRSDRLHAYRPSA
ncbi:MAG: alkaline phosphatase family protein [Kiloniellales bacterium]